MKTKIVLFLTFTFLLFTFTSFAQVTRSSLDTNIQNLFPDNSTGAITPLDLRTVDSNIVHSAVISLDDTNYVQVFDTLAYFYKGQTVIYHGDSIYRCKVALHHGAWTSSDFRFILH